MHSQQTVTKVATSPSQPSNSSSCSETSSNIHNDDDFDDFNHGPVFSITYLLLKHLLLSILLLMAIFTLVRLPLIDDHLRHVMIHDSTGGSSTPSSIELWTPPTSGNDKAVSGTRNHHLTNNRPHTSSSSNTNSNSNSNSNSSTFLDPEEERLYQRIKVIVILARIIVILVIFFGILGVIRENVNLVLVFVVFTSFRLITTLYVPYFHHGLTSSAVVFMITVMSLVFALMLMMRKRSLSASTMSLDKSYPPEVVIGDTKEPVPFTCSPDSYDGKAMRDLFDGIKKQHSTASRSSVVSINQGKHSILAPRNDRMSLPILSFGLHGVPNSPFSTLSTCSTASSTASSSSSSAPKSCIPSRIAAAMSHSLSHHSPNTTTTSGNNVTMKKK